MINRPKRGPAVTTAIEHLEALLKSHAHQLGSPLPNLQILADQAGVSRGSMWQAVATLKSRGLLQVTRGGRARIANSSAPSGATPVAARDAGQAPQSDGFAWQRFRDQILQRIIDGRYPDGRALPNRSQLAAEFNISYRTVRQGLQALVQQKMLSLTGQQFRPVRNLGSTGLTRLELIGLANLEGDFEVYSPRLRSFVTALEAECFNAQVTLKLLGLKPQKPSTQLDKLRRSGSEGVVIWLGDWVDRLSARNQVTQLLRHLAALDKRVVVIDEMGNLEYPSEGRPTQLRILRPAAWRAGHDLGLHLLRHGHTKVVWLSPYERHPWSQQRHLGIVSAFTEAGHPQGVTPCTHEELFDADDLAIAFCGGNPEWLEQVFDINRSNYNAKFSAAYIREVRERLQPSSSTNAVFRTERSTLAEYFRGVLQRLDHWKQKNYPLELLAAMRDTSLNIAAQSGFQTHVKPLLHAASLVQGATAWIGANDYMAASINRYLQSKNALPSKPMAIAGFDNAPESLDHHLTTYDFRLESFAREALDFCLKRPEPPARAKTKIREVEGMVIVRTSTALQHRR